MSNEAPEERRDEGDGRGERHDDRRVAAGEAVDDGLCGRALGLRLLDHVDDLGDGRVRGRCGGAHAKGAALDDGAGEDLVARSFGDRGGLAGDRRLVGGGVALEDHAVDRRPLSRPHDHDVADDDVPDVDRVLLQLAVVLAGTEHRRRRRRQPHQPADGPARPLQRRRLKHRTEAEQERDQRRLAPLPDGGGADHRQCHQDVHVDLARAQAEQGRARHEHAAADHGGAEEPGRRRGGDDARDEPGNRQEAGDESGQRAGLGEPEGA